MDLDRYLANVEAILLGVDRAAVERLVRLLVEAYKKEKTVFIVGNGGSAANASHLAQDLSKGVFLDRKVTKRIRALSLCDNIGYITAIGNDDGYEYVFETQLKALAKKGDVLIAISGSGNSKNILRCAECAHDLGATVVGVTGYDGGGLKKLADLSLHIPLREMGTVEGIHSVLFHYVVLHLREILTGVPFDSSSFSKTS
jgi:D-sedoheptulose 7-phosphate isomerase